MKSNKYDMFIGKVEIDVGFESQAVHKRFYESEDRKVKDAKKRGVVYTPRIIDYNKYLSLVFEDILDSKKTTELRFLLSGKDCTPELAEQEQEAIYSVIKSLLPFATSPLPSSETDLEGLRSFFDGIERVNIETSKPIKDSKCAINIITKISKCVGRYNDPHILKYNLGLSLEDEQNLMEEI